MSISARQLLDLYQNGLINGRDFIRKSRARGMAGQLAAEYVSSAAHAATHKRGGHISAATLQDSSSDLFNTFSLTGVMRAALSPIYLQITCTRKKQGNMGIAETVTANGEFDGYNRIERGWKLN